jgi:hypothetical protein
MLKAWTHERLKIAPPERFNEFEAYYDKNYDFEVAKGLFQDEVSIGHYAPNEETGYMKLKLQPISSESFSFEEEEAVAPSLGR